MPQDNLQTKNKEKRNRNFIQKEITQFITNNIEEVAEDSGLANNTQSITPPKHRIKGYSGNNPFELAEFLRSKVCKDHSRKYYRFRGGRFYGGIAAADCVGCLLDCVFCWSYKPRCNPESAGKFYEPKHVAEKLMGIANKNGYNKVRITGNEPTLCKEHLIEVLEYIPNNILFILETNGILLDNDYVKALTPFKDHLHVRVSLKGVNEEQFSYVTAMAGRFVEYPFKALEHLVKVGISCNAAIMQELLNEENITILVSRLKEIEPGVAQDLEVESLIMYPFISDELARRNLSKNFKPK